MKDEEILEYIKSKKFGKINSVVMSNRKGGYTTHIMKPYSGGNGLGSMGAVNVLDIDFKKKESAERIHKLIKKNFR